MSGVSWTLDLDGTALKNLDALSAEIARMPPRVRDAEQALRALDRAAAANAIARISDPLKAQQAALRLHVADLQRTAEAERKAAEAAKRAADEIGKAKDTEAKKFADAADAQRRAMEKALGVQQTAEAVALGTAIEKVAEGIADVGRMAVDSAVALTKFGIAASQRTRGQTIALGVTEGDKAGATLENLRLMASNAAVEADGVVERFIALRRAGFQAAEAQSVLAAGLDQRARGGSRADEALVEFFRKSRQTGKVESAEALDQLGRDAGIGGETIIDELAKVLGQSTKEAAEAFKAGKVSVSDAQTAVLNAVRSQNPGGKLGEMAKAFGAGDVEGQLTRLKDLSSAAFGEGFGAPFARTLKQIGDTISNEPFRTELAALATKFGTLFEGVEDVSLVDVFERSARAVSAAIDGINAFKSGLSDGYSAKSVEGVADAFDRIDAALGTSDKSVVLQRLGEQAGNLATGVAVAVRALETLAALIAKIPENLPIVDSLKSFGGLGSEGLVDGLRGRASSVVDAGAALGHSALDGVRNALDIRSPSRAMHELGAFTGEGFERGLAERDPGAALEASLTDAVQTSGAGARPAPVISFGDINVAGGTPEVAATIRAYIVDAVLEALADASLA